MSRHQIDTSVQFSAVNYDALSEKKKIEDPEAGPLNQEKYWVRVVPREPYLPDPALAEAVDLAIALGRPLLLQGDPGCGKTRLAHAVAYALGLPLEECYIKSTTRAQDLLYTYDAVRRIYDAQLGNDGPKGKDGEPLCRGAGNYVTLGPLGRAIFRAQLGRRSVVLLDEIDKADLDFPNDLLWELDRLEFRVAEVPGWHFRAGERANLRPIVIVTHNEEKALPTAFLRRCVYHYVKFPEKEDQLWRILGLHYEGQPIEPLGRKAIDVVRGLRQLDLSKKPGLSELIDWVGYLAAVHASPRDLNKVPYLGALIKDQNDLRRVREQTEGG